MTEKIELGDKLVNLRKSLGLSRPELSDRLGIDYQNLYKYETNQRMPAPDVINHLARFFGVTTCLRSIDLTEPGLQFLSMPQQNCLLVLPKVVAI